MKTTRMTVSRCLAVCCLLVTLLTSTGCVGVMAQLLYIAKGTEVQPPYVGLQSSKVAVVCVSDASAYGPDMLTSTISQAVAMRMKQVGKKIEVVSAAKVAAWIDQHGWDESDFVKLGKGVGAQKVVAIELGAYSIHEGSTLYKGRSDLQVTVYDLEQDGDVDFVYGPKEYSFPKNGRPVIQSSDRQFEAFFLANMTEHIANLFCPYDRMDQVARDAMSVDRM